VKCLGAVCRATSKAQLRLELEPGTVRGEKSFANESQSGAKVSSGNGNQQLIRNMNKDFITQGGTPITTDLATVIRSHPHAKRDLILHILCSRSGSAQPGFRYRRHSYASRMAADVLCVWRSEGGAGLRPPFAPERHPWPLVRRPGIRSEVSPFCPEDQSRRFAYRVRFPCHFRFRFGLVRV